MFKGEKKRTNEESPDRLNRLVSETQLTGDLVTNSSLRVDGKINGNVKCDGRLVVGEEGIITGDVTATEVELDGTVSGQINAEVLLTLHQTAVVKGDVNTERLVIEDGARIEGKIFSGILPKGTVPSPSASKKSTKKHQQKADAADMIY